MAERFTKLAPAMLAEAELLGNLVELYIHDLSAIFTQVELGPNGRYGYYDLQTYLTGWNGRSSYIIHHEGRVAGFVLVKRGSPFTDDPEVLDIAEFFVMRRFRGRGVGRDAAELLWNRQPGNWMVRAATKNPEAVDFWRHVITTYTHDGAEESERTLNAGTWAVFSFDSSLRSEASIRIT